MNEQELWKAALNEIELELSKASFVTWFKNTYISSKEEGVVSVAVPNTFTKEWMENRYNKNILRALRNNDNEVKEVQYVIENKKPKEQQPREEKPEEVEETQLKFEEFQVDKSTNLNPKYTLDTFVVGSSNELAYTAGNSIIENPGVMYNPLFVYGGVGLGKTHLLQAIGNELSKNKKSVLYLTSEKFTSDFISAVGDKNQGTNNFKNKYRNKDVLIIDDIQFIAGKERTQEEFFHTFNALHEQNKQIILSSDRPPKAIPTLEERLRSRFEGGMLVDIGYPDYETRIAILKSKIKDKNVKINDAVLNYIATNIQKNIRELEGALNLVIASSKLNKNEITLEKAKKVLSHVTNKPKKPISYKKVLKVVSDFYEIDDKDLVGKNRRREVVYPRQVAMYLMRNETDNSYPFIGEKFGGKDHTTVIHACTKVEERLKNDSSFEEEFNFIKQQLYSLEEV